LAETGAPSQMPSSRRRWANLRNLRPWRFLLGFAGGVILFFPVMLAFGGNAVTGIFALLLGVFWGSVLGLGVPVRQSVADLTGQFVVISGLVLLPSAGAYFPAPSGVWTFLRPFVALFTVVFVAAFLTDMLVSVVDPSGPPKHRGSLVVFIGALLTANVALSPGKQATWYTYAGASLFALVFGLRSGQIAATFAGRQIGGVIESLSDATTLVARYAKERAPLVAFFAAGYVGLVLWFAAVHHLVWWSDRSAYSGLPPTPGVSDFAFFSIATIATIGDGRTSAASDWARLAVGSELVVGFLWNTIVLASVASDVWRAARGDRAPTQPAPPASIPDDSPPSPS
jgi:hypothetical protein